MGNIYGVRLLRRPWNGVYVFRISNLPHMKRFRTISIAVFLLSVLCNSAFAENADLSFPYDPKTVPDEYVPISTISERIRDNSARFVFWNEDRFGAYPRFLA